jgi:oligopeptide transport system ATP-binding protein
MNKLIEVRDLKKHFPGASGWLGGGRSHPVKAVDGLSFDVYEGETLGIVGESGCGKSTTGRMLIRLIEPTEGSVRFEGQPLLDLNGKALKQARKHFQMVFQDPYASLNPRMTVRRILEEPMTTHGLFKGRRDKKIMELLDAVGIPAAAADRYPHEFSGGQRQRIGIARALAVEPKFIVADEPVAALDVSVQAQIVNLLVDLQQEFNLTYLFIAHDLSIVQYISRRVGVMYLGKLVELGSSDAVYERPLHPYTRSLLAAIPEIDPERRRERVALSGELPSPVNPPSGCRFHTRCPYATDKCKIEDPEFREIEPGHYAACHYAETFQGL